MPANEAIETALADDIRELEHIRETDAGAAGGEAVLDEAIARHHAAKEGLAKAMRVVLNAFAFRAAYGDDVMLQWPEGAPARMVAQVQHATSPKARERSEDKLWRLGWSPELVLGGQAAQTLREQSSRSREVALEVRPLAQPGLRASDVAAQAQVDIPDASRQRGRCGRLRRAVAGRCADRGSISTASQSFLATTCVFLKNGLCSIYRDRPLACWHLVNFDDDELLCRLVPGQPITVSCVVSTSPT